MALAEQEQEVDTKEQLFLAYYAQGAHYAQGMRDLLEAPPEPLSLRASVGHLSWAASVDALESVLGAVAGG